MAISELNAIPDLTEKDKAFLTILRKKAEEKLEVGARDVKKTLNIAIGLDRNNPYIQWERDEYIKDHEAS